MTTIAVPQGDTDHRPIVPDLTGMDMTALTNRARQHDEPEAIRIDVAMLALAFAQAVHKSDPTEEHTLRLTAAEVTYESAERDYLSSLSFTDDWDAL